MRMVTSRKDGNFSIFKAQQTNSYNMRWIFGFIMLWSMTVQAQDKSELNLNVETASRLAKLALKCVDQEYPNKLNQVISGPEDYKVLSNCIPFFTVVSIGIRRCTGIGC